MAKREVKLPNKLSDCIDIALADLSAVERMKKTYTVDMSDWHTPAVDEPDATPGTYLGKCSVCFAGAVMAKTLGVKPSEHVSIADFSEHNYVRLDALDDLREGYLLIAFSSLEKDLPFGMVRKVSVVPYAENPAQFKKEMKRLSKLLRVFGE